MQLLQVVEVLAGVPASVATVLLAMLPVGELRGALPVAVLVYKLPLLTAALLSIIGNMIPVYFLLVFFERGARWLRRRSATADRWITYVFIRTQRRLRSRVEQHGVWALALFVALPLPVSGAWTGALAAFVFGFDKGKAFLAILLGVIIATVIVSGATVGASYTVQRWLLL